MQNLAMYVGTIIVSANVYYLQVTGFWMQTPIIFIVLIII